MNFQQKSIKIQKQTQKELKKVIKEENREEVVLSSSQHWRLLSERHRVPGTRSLHEQQSGEWVTILELCKVGNWNGDAWKVPGKLRGKIISKIMC